MATRTRFAETLPPIENGDRMTQAEFHRLYEQRPDLHGIELIEGVVHLPSPIRFDQHSEPQSDVIAWLKLYAAERPELRAGGSATLILDRDNEVEPDAILMRRSEAGGQAHTNEQGYLVGAPELVVEVSASTRSIDLGTKQRVYRRNGVREYIVWSTHDGVLNWFALEDGDYVPLVPDERGVIESRVFPGLRLNVPALLAGDIKTVLDEQRTATG
jgi:Uma2 family endonuclease